MSGERMRGDMGSPTFDFSSLTFSRPESLSFSNKKERDFIAKARIRHAPVLYKHAKELVGNIDPDQDYFFLVPGSFIYGDFLEALCDTHQIRAKRIVISTLGMNRNNVDSLVNLVRFLNVGEIGLIVSTYFYSLERWKLIPYMIQEFAGEPISVSVCASHTKMCLIEREDEKENIVMYGSANLSSSNNLEEFALIHDAGVFQFCNRLLSGVLRDFTVYDGRTRKARFEFDGENTGKKMTEKAEEYLMREEQQT